MQNQVLGAHYPLGAENPTAPRNSTKLVNAQLLCRENLVILCATQDVDIENSEDYDDYDSSFNLDNPDVSPSTAPTLQPTNSTPEPIYVTPSTNTPETKTTNKHREKRKKLDMDNVINDNKENKKVL